MNSFSLPPAYPLAGEVLDGKYKIERMLGEGGMGAVAKATHLIRRAPVALKFMSPAVLNFPGAVERFINEGVAASQIDSDHVVKVFDVGQLPSGAPYLVMEYLEGRDLSELLAAEGSPGLPVARSVHFILQTLRGLQIAHQAGIVHRDMKPSNCFVVHKEGEPDFIKLVDFGISKVQQPDGGHLTRTNSALGTPLYMSPEQAKSPRDVDVRSDLYSVGVILYELLTGRTPFHSDTGEFTEILYKIFTTDPPRVETLRPDLPIELCNAIHGALTREADDRYATAADMGEALAPFADERSTQVLIRLRQGVQARGSQMPVAVNSPATAMGVPQIPRPPLAPQSIVPAKGGANVDVIARTQLNAADAAGSAVAAAQTGVGVASDKSQARRSPMAGVIAAGIGLFLTSAIGVGSFQYWKAAKSKNPISANSVTVDTSIQPLPGVTLAASTAANVTPALSPSAAPSAAASNRPIDSGAPRESNMGKPGTTQSPPGPRTDPTRPTELKEVNLNKAHE